MKLVQKPEKMTPRYIQRYYKIIFIGMARCRSSKESVSSSCDTKCSARDSAAQT